MARRWLLALWAALGFLALGCGVALELDAGTR